MGLDTRVRSTTADACFAVAGITRFSPFLHTPSRVSARMIVAGTQPSRDRRRGVLVRHLSLLGDDGGIGQETTTLLVPRRT